MESFANRISLLDNGLDGVTIKHNLKKGAFNHDLNPFEALEVYTKMQDWVTNFTDIYKLARAYYYNPLEERGSFFHAENNLYSTDFEAEVIFDVLGENYNPENKIEYYQNEH